jgi:hypothetical protein
MPTFSTYHGQLPEHLNPLNPSHYVLLAYWIYFRPTALKFYIYRVSPDCYWAEPEWGNLRRAWFVPGYRSLYLMTPIVALSISILVGVPIMLAIGCALATPVEFLEWMAGMVVGVAVGATFGLVTGIMSGSATGVALMISRSVTFGTAVGAAIGLTISTVLGTTNQIAHYLVISLVTGTAIGAAVGIARSVVTGLILSVMVGLVIGGTHNVLLGVAAGILFATGVLRFLFYPFHLVSALHSLFRGGRHPLEWDELVVLPLPGTQQVLAHRLQRGSTDGLCFVAAMARNPFQRWIVQRVLQTYLHNQTMPLHALYALLTNTDLDTSVFVPVTRHEWGKLPTIKRMLLGELAGQFLDPSSDSTIGLAERLVWTLTWFLLDRHETPLTQFEVMLYELLDAKIVEDNRFDLWGYHDIFASLTDYIGGLEIACSFEALAAFLSYGDLSDLPSAAGIVGGFTLDLPSIRPTVLTALEHLGQVGSEIATYRDATSRVNKLAVLARAINALDGLGEYIEAEVMDPERDILRRIIRQWRRLVSDASGKVGRAEVRGPVANPYVVANPVTGDLFVGREDVLRRLEELWAKEGQRPSVVLYGHRRMGKSSILHNLGVRFGSSTAIVDFNMQRVGLVSNTGELLFNLALALYDSLPLSSRKKLESVEPDEDGFAVRNPYIAFDRFLKQIERVRAEWRFIIAVDEFELIESMISEGKLESHLLCFWRGLIQTYPWFVMVFAGLHTLQEMTGDYWHPLYGSVATIPVSFLSHDAAWQLITQPTPDFSLDYDANGVEHIIALTNGQPYLVQLIGHGLVTRFNRQTFEEGVERERRFGLTDVEAVIGAPEFYRDGDAYFTGVWRQAETSQPPGQTAVLRMLASSEAGLSLEDLTGQSSLSDQAARDALETLKRHDVVTQRDGRWRFTVELMRHWVAQKEVGQ